MLTKRKISLETKILLLSFQKFIQENAKTLKWAFYIGSK
jgi:hypothetical protein